MDPRQLFVDRRLQGYCVYCGRDPDTRDHVPSRVLLDEPYPSNLAVVDCCLKCNTEFSIDEEYLAAFVECVIYGTTHADKVSRPKISRILEQKPELSARIAKTETKDKAGNQSWVPETDRVAGIVLKLARGHVAYELGLLQLDTPVSINFVPIDLMSDPQFENFMDTAPNTFSGWPEIGSRAFINSSKQTLGGYENWLVVQPGRYHYLVSQIAGITVRMIIFRSSDLI